MKLIFSFFFFSSRRRHTRCSRDWSSDVCSSDLRRGANKLASDVALAHRACARRLARLTCDIRRRRSEERRVGKECRSRWSQHHKKKTKIKNKKIKTKHKTDTQRQTKTNNK